MQYPFLSSLNSLTKLTRIPHSLNSAFFYVFDLLVGIPMLSGGNLWIQLDFESRIDIVHLAVGLGSSDFIRIKSPLIIQQSKAMHHLPVKFQPISLFLSILTELVS